MQHGESFIPQHSWVAQQRVLGKPQRQLEACIPLLCQHHSSACTALRRNPLPQLRLWHSWGGRSSLRQTAGRGESLHLAKHIAAVLSLISGIMCMFERVQLPKRDRETKSKWEERPSHCTPSEVAFPSDGCYAHDDSVNHHPTFWHHKPQEAVGWDSHCREPQ